MSNPWDILILGCGQLGGNLKTVLEAEKFRVLGVRRTKIPNDPTMMSLDLETIDSWDQLAQLPLAPYAVIIACLLYTSDAADE